MDKKAIDLYLEYRNQRMDRRSFLKRLITLTGNTAAAVALIPLLENKFIRAQMISGDDARLDTTTIQYPGETGRISAYLAKPKGDSKHPGIIVIHENKGLCPHIRDVTRRVALEGFIVIAPDALSPLGGSPIDPDKAQARMRELDPKSTVKNYVAAVKYLKTHPQTTGKVGCIGFCWGGGVANQVAVLSADLTAAVPFYGRQPKPEDVPNIKASLLCHYGSLDKRINEGIEGFETALKANSVKYNIFLYEGAKHAFFNDTRPDRYHPEAAKLAWKRTITFFKEELKT